jgi:uridine kinase
MTPTAKALELSVQTAVARIASAQRQVDPRRSTLVAISGIDGSGKGYLTREIDRHLRDRGFTVAVVNIDGWLRLPHERFSSTRPAEHFYTNAFRFGDMFEKLVVPLRERRWVSVEADFAEETASAYRKFHYQFSDIDIILLEGIYLLKREYQHHHDVSLWIDCSFDTALKRAVARAQERLPPEETVRAYRQIYFPAQELHFWRDSPRQAASLILDNDPFFPEVLLETRTAGV